MKKIYQKIKSTFLLLGFNPTVFINFFRSLPLFIRDYLNFKNSLKKNKNTDFMVSSFLPVMGDRYNLSGSMKGHYFHQDLLVAKKIFLANPKRHVDIGSSISSFVAHVAVFREIEVFDIRPQISNVKNIIFRQADLMKLPSSMKNYCESISSLHAIEHFGLGRYGDPIDSEGHLKGLNNIFEILKPGGKFYFSVPIGPQRIEFHAHRVFNVSYLVKIFEPNYTINSFSYVDDEGDLHEDVEQSDEMIITNFGCKYGCGIFELTKK